MRGLWLILIVPALLVGGCSFLDSLTGVNNPSDAHGGVVGTVGQAASGLPGYLGLAGTLLGTLGAVYANIRRKQYLQGVEALVTGVDKATKAGTSSTITKDELYAALEQAKQEIMSNPQLLTDLVSFFKARARG